VEPVGEDRHGRTLPHPDRYSLCDRPDLSCRDGRQLHLNGALLAGTTTAQASFAGSKVRRGGSHGGAFYYRQFSFRTRDGRQVAFVAGIGFTDQPYVDRQRVTIVYDPANPEHAELASFWSLWAVTLFLAPFALLFTGIPAAVFVLMRGRRDLQPQQDFV
jgi:hypothetical protein